MLQKSVHCRKSLVDLRHEKVVRFLQIIFTAVVTCSVVVLAFFLHLRSEFEFPQDVRKATYFSILIDYLLSGAEKQMIYPVRQWLSCYIHKKLR